MTTIQLKGILNSVFNNNRIVQLPNDLDGVPDFQKIWNEHLGNTTIPFTPETDDPDQLIYTGTGNYWNTTVDFSLQFYTRRGKVDYKIEMTFPDDWRLQDSWPQYIPSSAAPLLSKSKLIFISAPQVPGLEALDEFDRDPHLYFSAEQKVEGALLPIKWLLGEAPTLQLIGPVTIEHALPDMELIAHVSETVKMDFFNQLPVAFIWNSEIIESPDQPNTFQNLLYFEIQVFIPFQDEDIILKANFQNDSSSLNFQAALNNIALNSLTQLNVLCHDTDLGAILPKDLQLSSRIGLSEMSMSLSSKKKTVSSVGFTLSSTEDWEIMDGFNFSDIGLTIEVERPGKKTLRKTSAEISGAMNLATAQLLLAAHYPENNMTAALAEDNVLPITELTSRIFPIGELPNVELSRMNMDFAPGEKQIKVATQLDLAWGINFGSNAILLQDVALDLLKNETDKEVKLTATSNLLGLDFNLTGEYQGADSGWTFTGISQADTVLSISTLVESIIDFFGVTVPLYNPDIKIGAVEIILNTKTKRFHLAAHSSIQTALHIASKRVLVDTTVSIQSSLDQTTKKRSLVGNINASVELVAGFLFQLKFTMNDAQPVTYGSWKMTDGNSLSLDDLLSALGIDKATFSDPATKEVVSIVRENVLDNLALTGISFSFQGPKKQLSLKADTEHFGSLVLSAHKDTASNKWAQVIGLEFPPNTKLSDIPGLKEELSATDFMNFKNVSFLISTHELNGASLQKISSPDQDLAATETFLEGTSLFLSRGLNVAAKIDLENTADASLKNLRGATDLDSLTIQAALGKSELNFRSSLGGEIGFSVGDDQLDFKDPYVQLDVLPKFGLQLGGSIIVDFNDIKLKAEGGIVITPMEASGRLMVSAHDPDVVDTSAANATGNLLEPLGIKGIKLNSIGFIVGATFFPPGIKFGMQAGFQIGNQAPSVNKLATIFQVIPAVPTPVVNMQLLSFQLQEMDVNTMLTVFTNDNAPELPQFINEIRATDLGFFYCSTVTTLPDGNTALPGFGFHGNVNLFGFKTRAALQINPISGISGEFQMSPMEIKSGEMTILSVRGKGEALSNYFMENENGEWEKISPEAALLPRTPEDLENDVAILPTIKEEVIMDGGGPVFKFDTNGPRYLFASVQASLFDFISMEIEAEISNTGMSFLYHYQVSDILEIEFDLDVNWTGNNPGFSGHASFDLDLDFEVPLPFGLPSIDLDAGLRASATLKVDKSEFLFKIDGGFHFEGIDFTIPTIEIKIAFSSLKDIAEKIMHHILENAAEIFKEIFAFLEEAWNEFKEGAEILYNETKELVENIGKEAVAVAEDALEFAEAAVEKVEEVLEDIGEEIVQAYETGRQFVEDTAEAIVEIGKAAAEAFDDFVEEAAAVFKAAGEFAEKVYEEARQFVENVGKEIAHIANEAVKAVKKFARDAAREAKKILDAAVRVAKEIWDGIKSTVAALLHAAKQLEQLAVAIWREIDQFLADAAKAIADTAEDVVDWVSDAGSAIGNTLEEAC